MSRIFGPGGSGQEQSHRVTQNGLPSDLDSRFFTHFSNRFQPSSSPSDWPVDGGRLLHSDSSAVPKELLLTGHEDGSVMFWDAGGVTMKLVYKLGTAVFFGEGELPPQDADEDEWPPFRKVGQCGITMLFVWIDKIVAMDRWWCEVVAE